MVRIALRESKKKLCVNEYIHINPQNHELPLHRISSLWPVKDITPNEKYPPSQLLF